MIFVKNLEPFVLAASYFRPEGLSSPQLRLTAVFGMGTGIAIAPNHQNKGFNPLYSGTYLKLLRKK
jgi:hypothetical protein